MVRLVELPGQLLETFWINWPANTVRRPRGFAHSIEGESHPARMVALCVACVSLMHNLRMNDDRVRLAVVVEAFNLHRRNADRRYAVPQPIEHHEIGRASCRERG